MIELLRYARLKPHGVVSVEVLPHTIVRISFKRFSVEIPNKEETPEISDISFPDLEARLVELQTELEVVKELLALKPK
jgi:hypothetical protein